MKGIQNFMETTEIEKLEETIEIRDIFDRIMSCRIFRKLWPFYKKNKGALLYLFFGAGTTLVNLGVSAFLWYVLGWEKIRCQTPFGEFALGTFGGNAISIFAAIVFAYITNKIYVFESETHGGKELMAEFARFVGGRLSTMIIELGGVQLAVVLLPDSGVYLFAAKLLTQIIVVIINYFISKFLVFKGNKKEE
jgi:putative flippase GtrA